MKTPFILIALLMATTSCKSFQSLMTDPGREDFIKGNRFSGGPTINELHGSDQKSMLESYAQIADDLSALQLKYKEREAERDDFASELEELKQEFDLKTNMVTAAESEARRLRVEKRNLESKALSLSIENARCKRDLLTYKIAGLNRQIGDLSSGVVEANATPMGR